MMSSNTVNIPTASTSFTKPAPHPVTAILGMTHNPVTYMAPNVSSIIEGTLGSDSDSTNSVSVSTSVLVPQNVKVSMKDTSPLHTPHFYWHCLMSSKSQEFPLSFSVLIYHRSSTVSISEEYVSILGLHRKHQSPNLILQICKIAVT